MATMITIAEKRHIVNDRIQNIDNCLIWLDNNPSEGDIPEGKLSTQQQKDILLFKKNVLSQVLDSLI